MAVYFELYCIVGTGGDEPRWFSLFASACSDKYIPVAKESGLYEWVWDPLLKHLIAGDLIDPLTEGIALMESDKDRFIALADGDDGWKNYYGFLNWVKKCLTACARDPEALVWKII